MEGRRLNIQEKVELGTSLVVQWLRLHASNAGGTGSVPGKGTKIPHVVRCGKKKKKNRKEKAELY